MSRTFPVNWHDLPPWWSEPDSWKKVILLGYWFIRLLPFLIRQYNCMLFEYYFIGILHLLTVFWTNIDCWLKSNCLQNEIGLFYGFWSILLRADMACQCNAIYQRFLWLYIYKTTISSFSVANLQCTWNWNWIAWDTSPEIKNVNREDAFL